jgi:hypothetical protein
VFVDVKSKLIWTAVRSPVIRHGLPSHRCSKRETQLPRLDIHNSSPFWADGQPNTILLSIDVFLPIFRVTDNLFLFDYLFLT